MTWGLGTKCAPAHSCASAPSAYGNGILGCMRLFWVQALLGGGASVVLEGQRVIPSRAQDAGFRFQYSTVHQAIANIYR